ncbi:hypothetical protein ACSBR1_035532 [Camellia fascicularis]
MTIVPWVLSSSSKKGANKFETMWSTRIDYVDVIYSKWDVEINGFLMFQLEQKSKSCLNGLQDWSKATFDNNKLRIGQLKSDLLKLQANDASDENL